MPASRTGTTTHRPWSAAESRCVTAETYVCRMGKKRKRHQPQTKHSATSTVGSTVYGESASVLLSTLAKSDFTATEDGMYQMELTMDPDEAPPVIRAVMRAEAELLLSDADELVPFNLDQRTPEQRRADALCAVVMLHQGRQLTAHQADPGTTRCADRRSPG